MCSSDLTLKAGQRRHCASAYLTFVALDETGRPTPVPALAAESDEDQRRLRAAEGRRDRRLARRQADGGA